MDTIDLYQKIAKGLHDNPDLRWGSQQDPPLGDGKLTVHVTNTATQDRFKIVITKEEA